LVKEVVGLANAITDVTGIEVGHYTDKSSATGCTVVLYREGAVTGVDVRGGAPGTRETDLLRPENRVDQAHAVLLSGGSAFGLNAAAGVMRYLEEQGVGYQAGPALVPIVPAAILFDLALITSEVRPGPEEGYKACLGCSNREVEEGTIGAGTGATVGKLLGIDRAIKGGIGTASLELPGGVIVGAIVAVNAHGGVVDYTNGKTIAGPRRSDGPGIYDTVDLLLNGHNEHGAEGGPPGTNTTIGVVATNAALTKAQANFLARVSHDGLALAIRPCHTTRDGDTLFAMATGEVSSDIDLVGLGAAAVEVVARSVLRAVRTATGLGGVPSLKELGYE
jgi:L-aminopeptidase/D-esterase-like protein